MDRLAVPILWTYACLFIGALLTLAAVPPQENWKAQLMCWAIWLVLGITIGFAWAER